jgi:very-short-patch-repair endonuclease
MRVRTGQSQGWGAREKIERARALRREMTPAERTLWSALRRSARGPRVRRQHPVLGWIADFYIPSARLVIELDGSAHLGNEGADAERTASMERVGVRVLRLRNEAVLNRLADVCATILVAVEE